MSYDLCEGVLECLRAAGSVLLDRFCAVHTIKEKENHSSIVTEADEASERRMLEIIQTRFPNHAIISEEMGFRPGAADYVWILDPLDGTSNFVSGLPWFGPLAAVLWKGKPIAGGMLLPAADKLYFSEDGHGATCNGEPIHVTTETQLRNTLCAYSLDAAVNEVESRTEAELFRLLVAHTRNVRSTNCLVDFCYTADGRFGLCVNQACRIWDIAPAALIIREAGGILTDFQGNELTFNIAADGYGCRYRVAGGSCTLHRQLLDLMPSGRLSF